jgi:uncharacterized membrane protein (DUF106 family)
MVVMIIYCLALCVVFFFATTFAFCEMFDLEFLSVGFLLATFGSLGMYSWVFAGMWLKENGEEINKKFKIVVFTVFVIFFSALATIVIGHDHNADSAKDYLFIFFVCSLVFSVFLYIKPFFLDCVSAIGLPAQKIYMVFIRGDESE